ncbi:DUF6029 family protein [Flavobacterium sp.]|jgi:hypothetical protein|uniref:DUF6029 family protein n=1 Tax=Flavobacterium sp. TaxID=239 RepID=UPI0037BED57D
MKKLISFTFLFSALFSFAQNADSTKTKVKVYGSFERNGQWYTNDKNRGIHQDTVPLRANNYFNVNFNYKKFTFGTQVESYMNEALLNFNPKYKGTNFATYYANYKTKKLDITLGHYYVQFGSGLALRTWEDRSLGINNALRGAKVVYSPIDEISFTALYGKARSGFDVANGDVFGFNTDVNVSQLLNLEAFDFKYGFSAVSRYEKLPVSVQNFSAFTNLFSNRFELAYKNYYVNTEYVFKSRDAIIKQNILDTNFAKEGSALLVNFGYSKKGIGFDANLRRVENMQLLAQRNLDNYPTLSSTSLNYNDKILNFVPSLTKQHHSNLANIYVYQAQFQVVMDESTQVNKFGEIGGEFDFFYDFKKGSALGGEYGTKINLNVSSWYNLKAKYRYINNAGENAQNYQAELFNANEKYFSDYNIEITKKVSKNFKTAFTYINQYYNNKQIQGIFNEYVVNSHTIFSESTYQLSDTKSITFSLEHMWADNDRKNWAAGTVEYNHNEHWSIFAMDMYNYGFDHKTLTISETDLFDIHFYNFGTAYKKGSTRVAINYGRQRGGLVCAGGVCRFVPPSTGLGLQITTSF